MENDQQKTTPLQSDIDRSLPDWATNSNFTLFGPQVFAICGGCVAAILFRERLQVALLVGAIAGVAMWFVLYAILMTVLGNIAATRLDRRGVTGAEPSDAPKSPVGREFES